MGGAGSTPPCEVVRRGCTPRAGRRAECAWCNGVAPRGGRVPAHRPWRAPPLQHPPGTPPLRPHLLEPRLSAFCCGTPAPRPRRSCASAAVAARCSRRVPVSRPAEQQRKPQGPVARACHFPTQTAGWGGALALTHACLKPTASRGVPPQMFDPAPSSRPARLRASPKRGLCNTWPDPKASPRHRSDARVRQA